MNIFQEIKNSVYNKEYYKSTVLNESLGQSLKYLVKVCLVVAIAATIVLGCLSPVLVHKLKGGADTIIVSYPNGLVISIVNGNVSVNQPEPIFIKVPESFGINSKPGDVTNLLTINTKEPFTMDAFKSYSTAALLTSKEIVTVDSNGGLKIIPIKQSSNETITQSWLLEKEAAVIRVMPWIILFGLVFCLIFIFSFQFSGIAIGLFFYALITWVVCKARGIKLTYKKYYQISAHAITLVIAVNILGVFVHSLSSIFIKILVLAAVVYLNFDQVFKEGGSEPVIPVENPEIKN